MMIRLHSPNLRESLIPGVPRRTLQSGYGVAIGLLWGPGVPQLADGVQAMDL